jgi:hypothetical protein
MPDRNLRPRRNQQNVINSAEEPESGEGDEEEGDEEESDDDIDIDEEVDIKQVSHYDIFLFSMITFMPII